MTEQEEKLAQNAALIASLQDENKRQRDHIESFEACLAAQIEATKAALAKPVNELDLVIGGNCIDLDDFAVLRRVLGVGSSVEIDDRLYLVNLAKVNTTGNNPRLRLSLSPMGDK